MSTATLIVVGITGILAIVSGWLVPLIFKSQRPYGLFGDILVCTIPAILLAYVGWVWLWPALGFDPGWLPILSSIGDSLALGWICLWLVRKIKS